MVRESCGITVSSAFFKSRLFEDIRNGVSDGGGRSKRQVDYSERHSETAGHLICDELSRSCYLERGLLDGFGDFGKISVAFLESGLDDAGSRNTDVYRGVGLDKVRAPAFPRRRSENVAFYRIGRYLQGKVQPSSFSIVS